MNKHKKIRKLEVNKKIAVVLLAVLIIIGLIGANLYGKASLNSALKQINRAQNESTEYVVQEIETWNAITKNKKQINFDTGFNYERNANLISENERLVNQVENRIKEFCDKEATRYNLPLNFFAKAVDKTKYNNIVEVSKMLSVRLGDACTHLEGYRSFYLFTNDMQRATNDMTRMGSTNYEDTTPAAALAKFSDGTYKVSNMSQIRAIYGDAAETAINDKIRIAALFYESYAAARDGDASLSASKYKDYQAAFNKADASGKSADDANKSKAKTENAGLLKNEVELYNLVSKLNTSPKKTEFSKGVWSANLLATAANSYSGDNDDKYPKTTEISELVQILKDKRYLDNVEPYTKDFSYSSSGDTSFSLGFKNELTGKTYTFVLVGQ